MSEFVQRFHWFLRRRWRVIGRISIPEVTTFIIRERPSLAHDARLGLDLGLRKRRCLLGIDGLVQPVKHLAHDLAISGIVGIKSTQLTVSPSVRND